ncbi:MAG: elongation factor P [bacterium]|nr:elongation factor P [bacterium]
MAMLNYNEVTPHKFILRDGEPYEVLTHWVFRKQQRKPVNQTKLKNLISGKVLEITFHQNDKVEEADMGTREIKYLYTNRGEHWFCDPRNPSDRFMLSNDLAGDALRFTKTNSLIDGITFDDRIISIRPPAKVELKVTEAAPAVKGNTSGNALKIVTLETGTTVNVPMFINEGDVIRVNTETGEYAERVEKA